MSNPWIFESEAFEKTPSARDGVTQTEQNIIRIKSVDFIKRLGAEALKLHYNTVATGAIFFHRFYMFQSYKQFPWYPMAATCLFLAGKVEETPKKSNDIVKYSKSILSDVDFAQFGADPKEEILTLERILLQTLRFDLEVEHPYEHLIKYSKQLTVTSTLQGTTGEQERRCLLQAGWTFANDTYNSVINLQYEPEIVAIAVILLACKTNGFDVNDWDNKGPGQAKWWDAHVENLDQDTLEGICHQLLDVIEIGRKLAEEREQKPDLI